MVEDGSMEVEMSQAIAGARGTTFICEEVGGTSVLKVIEGTVEYTSKASGKKIEVNGGQMAAADSKGLGKVTTFNINAELETWDKKTQQLTAEALEKSKGGSGLVLIIVIFAIVMLASVIVILLIMKRKPATASTIPYIKPPVYQKIPDQSERGNPSAARFAETVAVRSHQTASSAVYADQGHHRDKPLTTAAKLKRSALFRRICLPAVQTRLFKAQIVKCKLG